MISQTSTHMLSPPEWIRVIVFKTEILRFLATNFSLLLFFILVNSNVTVLPMLMSKCLSFSSVQFSSVAQSCPTLCDPMNCSRPGLPVYHHLQELTQTHVHWVGDAIQPSHFLHLPKSYWFDFQKISWLLSLKIHWHHEVQDTITNYLDYSVGICQARILVWAAIPFSS